ncbi:MAG: ribonuclease H [Campylobacterales bacterium]|nr:ribonuclease H [Campylobacterales bacterium]
MMSKNTNRPTILLFTDGSVNPKTNIGYGAYLVMDEDKLSSNLQIEDIKTKRFENTSSTKLELETLLWALSEIDLENFKIIVYTDCQNIIGLSDRREGFEKNHYISRTNKLIKNHELYKEFYKNMDLTESKFIKIKGHIKNSKKDEIDNIFTLVDKASRAALRKVL